MANPLSTLENVSPCTTTAHVDASHKALATKTAKPKGPQKDACFLPTECPEDRFLHELYRQCLVDEYGKLRPNLQGSPLPPLKADEIAALAKIFTDSFLVKDREGMLEIDLKIKDLLTDLQKRIKSLSINIDCIEVVGSTVSSILTLNYFRTAFALLGMKNVDDFITPELFKESKRKLPDFDLRINVPFADVNALDILRKEVPKSLASFKTSDLYQLYQLSKYIQNSGLQKFQCVNEKDVRYSIVGIGDPDSTTLELLFVQHLPRLHLFLRDALRIRIDELLQAIDTPGASLNIIPQSDHINGWQALLDNLTGMINDDNPDTIDIYGWPMLMSHYTRGRCSPRQGFSDRLFNNFLKRCNPCYSLPNQLGFFLSKCLKNHHREDPYAAICLTFNACQSWPRALPASAGQLWKEMSSTIKNGLKHTNEEKCNPSEKLLHAIFKTLEGSPSSFEAVTSVLQLKAFSYLCRPQSKPEKDEPEFILRKNNGMPAIEVKFHGEKGSYSLMLPFNPEKALEALQTRAEGQSAEFHKNMQSLLNACPVAGKCTDGAISPVMKYLPHLGLNMDSLIDKVSRNLDQASPQPFVKSINHEILIASLGVQKNPHLEELALTCLPSLLMDAQSQPHKDKLIEALESHFINGADGHDICTAISSAASCGKSQPRELYLSWLEALAEIQSTKYEGLAVKLLPRYLSQWAPAERAPLIQDLYTRITPKNINLSLRLWQSLKKDQPLSWNQQWQWLHELLSASLNKTDASQQKQVYLLGISKVISEFVSNPSPTNQKSIPASFGPDLCKMASALIQNNYLAEAKFYLELITTRQLAHGQNLANLWTSYCQAHLSNSGALRAIEIWNEAQEFNVWSHQDKNWQSLLLDITLGIYALEVPAAKDLERKFFSLCLQQNFGTEQQDRMSEIVGLHLEQMFNARQCATALKEIQGQLGQFLTEDQKFDMRVKAFQLDMAGSRFPQATASLKEILAMSPPRDSSSTKQKLVVDFLEVLLKPLATKNMGWNLNNAAQILMHPEVRTLFSGAISNYHRLMELAISCCFEADPHNNRTLLYSIIELFITTSFPSSSTSLDKKYLAEKTKHLIKCLAQLCPPKFSYPASLQTVLSTHANELVKYSAEDADATVCIELLKVFHSHKIKTDFSESIWQSAGKKLLDYLKACNNSDAHTQAPIALNRANDVNQILASFITKQRFCDCIQPSVLLNLYVHLISTFIRNNSSLQALRWIDKLLQLEPKHSKAWHAAIPNAILEWAPDLVNQREHKKCLETLTFLKDHCAEMPSALPSKLFALVDDHLIKKDPLTCAGILLDHQALLSKAIPATQLTTRASDLTSHVLKETSAPAKLQKAISLLSSYKIPRSDLWKTGLMLSSRSEDNHVLKTAADAFLGSVERSQLLKENAADRASCLNYMLQILGKSRDPRIFYYFKDLPNRLNRYKNPSLKEAKREFLHLLFTYGTQVAIFSKDLKSLQEHILPARDKIEPSLEYSPELCLEIDMALVAEMSETTDFNIYTNACNRFHRATFSSGSGNPSNVSENLTRLIVAAGRFTGSQGTDLEKVVASLTTRISQCTSFNTLPVAETLSKFSNFTILSNALKAFSNQIDLEPTHLIGTFERCTVSNSGIVKLFKAALATNNPIVIQTANSCLKRLRIHQYINKDDYSEIWGLMLIRALNNVRVLQEPSLHEQTMLYFIEHFHFVSSNKEISDKCCEVFFAILYNFLVQFDKRQEFSQIAASFFQMLEHGKPDVKNPLKEEKMPVKCIVEYNVKYIENALNVARPTQSLACFLLSHSQYIIQSLIRSAPQEHDLLVPVLRKFVFSTLADLDFTIYQPHLNITQAMIIKALSSHIFDEHLTELFELDLYLTIDSNKKFVLKNETKQIEILLRLFREICGNSPYKLWHAIDVLERLPSLSALDQSPNALACCYKDIITSLEGNMFYHVGGVPIYEHLHQKIINDPRLNQRNKSPEWQSACLDIYNMFTHTLLKLCINGPVRPTEIPDQYEPFDFLYNVLAKALFNDMFENKHQEYLRLVAKLFIPAIQKMQKNPAIVSKYAINLYRLLTFVSIRSQPLTKPDLHSCACRVVNWIAQLASSGIPGALEQAKLILDKAENEKKLFKDFPDELEKAKRALER